MKKVIAVFFLLAGLSAAVRAEDQWVFLPGQTFESMLRGGGVAIMSTDALRWPDGRNVLVTYLRTADNTYRCVSAEGEPIQQSRLGCYRLTK
jgi:hypothetical protein